MGCTVLKLWWMVLPHNFIYPSDWFEQGLCVLGLTLYLRGDQQLRTLLMLPLVALRSLLHRLLGLFPHRAWELRTSPSHELKWFLRVLQTVNYSVVSLIDLRLQPDLGFWRIHRIELGLWRVLNARPLRGVEWSERLNHIGSRDESAVKRTHWHRERFNLLGSEGLVVNWWCLTPGWGR